MIIAALLLAAADPIVVATPPPPPAGKTRPPKPANSPGEWILFSDYPEAAVAEHREGKVTFKVSVAPDGYVIGCDVTKSSGSDDLDNSTCALVTLRAMFTPARDADGKATSGTYSNSVSWDLPEPDPVPVAAKPGQ